MIADLTIGFGLISIIFGCLIFLSEVVWWALQRGLSELGFVAIIVGIICVGVGMMSKPTYNPRYDNHVHRKHGRK